MFQCLLYLTMVVILTAWHKQKPTTLYYIPFGRLAKIEKKKKNTNK